MPVTILSILAAKITEPEYCSLSSFLVKASPLGSVKKYILRRIYFSLIEFYVMCKCMVSKR